MTMRFEERETRSITALFLPLVPDERSYHDFRHVDDSMTGEVLFRIKRRMTTSLFPLDGSFDSTSTVVSSAP